MPTPQPTPIPIFAPSVPTIPPTSYPTFAPTDNPSKAPSKSPTFSPSTVTKAPTASPTASSKSPTSAPSTITKAPTASPTASSKSPTFAPSTVTKAPSTSPIAPSKSPTSAPSTVTKAPTASPTASSKSPTFAPSTVTEAPTASPTAQSKSPTFSPSNSPTFAPSVSPTFVPSTVTNTPTTSPTALTLTPTASPTPCIIPTSVHEHMAAYVQAVYNPHVVMWNGGQHYFKGSQSQAHQYYYMHPCNGTSKHEMPFAVLGTHEPFDSKVLFTYAVLELFDDDGSEFLVWFDTTEERRKWTVRSESTDTFYERNSDTYRDTYLSLEDGVRFEIGNRFQIYYYMEVKNNKNQYHLQLTIDGDCTITLMMKKNIHGQEQAVWFHVLPPDNHCYQCHSCGLFGDFLTSKREAQIPGCDGLPQRIPGGRNSQENYDINGWSWSKGYVDDNCNVPQTRRRILQQNEGSYVYVIDDNYTILEGPCNASIAQPFIDECGYQRMEQYECCDNIIGGTFCDTSQRFCEMDACNLANGNTSLTFRVVHSLFYDLMDYVCTLPNVDSIYVIYGYDTTATEFDPDDCSHCSMIDCCNTGCEWRDDPMCIHGYDVECCVVSTLINTIYTSDIDGDGGEKGE
eukprot:199991_1